jgi:Fe2+ transport system protein FeoA
MEMILDRQTTCIETKEEGMDKDMVNNLTKVKINSPQIIRSIQTNDHAMCDFLFTLGCYEGQTITVISKLGSTYVVNINNARYSIDSELAKAIII